MRLYVVSDLHITHAADPIYTSLLRLMHERVQGGDILVLAGDVFDLFVGNKPIFLRRYAQFFEAVQVLGQRGAEVHYIEGNHDFLIRRAFGPSSIVKVHSRSTEIQVGDRKFFLAHGDLVDPTDHAYRFLRGFFRSPVLRAAVTLAPGVWVDGIGQLSSKMSSRRSRVIPIARMEEVRKIYRSYAAERLKEGFDYVILGHCHDLDEMSFRIGDRLGQYINVGYPREHHSLLGWSPGEDKITREALPE